MKRNFIILFSLLLFFAKCNTHSIKLESSIDPDIVLVNIENGDRAFIGEVLQKVDSLNPLVVGIDVKFPGRKKTDSILVAALGKLKNDILIYNVKQDGLIDGSDSVFSYLANQGNLYYEEKMNLITTIIPLQKINGKIHESFAFKIVKQWKPDFISQIKVNDKIDINYTRNLGKFLNISGSELLGLNASDLFLPNKIFLVGYIGPENEDKHFTPMRYFDDYKSDEPDTYGLVIIANEIRTILEYKR